MRESFVRREEEGEVVTLTLNRPERRNALSNALVVGLGEQLSRLETSAGCRALVLTGAGPVFCAGMDLKEAVAQVRTAEQEKRAIVEVQAIADLLDQLHRFPKPTIAALNGDAFAGGAGLALACDFVVASDHARVGFPEVRRGLVATIVMQDLVRQVGERRARALLLSGESISASEAERWGLVTQVVEPGLCLLEAQRLARSLRACAPLALATTKRMIDETLGRPSNLRGPAAVTAAVRVSEEAEEGMQAFLNKREPRWLSEA